MTEMMIAVVILGIGLLITASMFPIAWYKARDVHEAAFVPTAIDSGEAAIRLLAHASDVRRAPAVPPQLPERTSFFAGDYTPSMMPPPIAVWNPTVFSDTRVHAMNLGNYLAGDPAGDAKYTYLSHIEPEWLDDSAPLAPVGDNTWSLEETIIGRIGDSGGTVYVQPILQVGLHRPVLAPHARLMPPIPGRPQPTEVQAFRLWSQQFENRRYCWGVLYRFETMRGPRANSEAFLRCFWNKIPGADPVSWLPECPTADYEGKNSPASETRVAAYYVTLKRPAGARYARQEGDPAGPGGAMGGWTHTMDHPRALPAKYDVLLPTPWHIEAELLFPPGSPPAGYQCLPASGIPSEIVVNDAVLAAMLQVGVTLVDDRTGQVFRITQRKLPDGAQPNRVVLTLGGEYTPQDLYGTYRPDSSGNCLPERPVVQQIASTPTNPKLSEPQLQENWFGSWLAENWQACVDAGNPRCVGGNNVAEVPDTAERRFYWVYPPPVERERTAGVPVFTGSPPVVGIEARQMILN